jgi:hypothetical protein
MGLLTNEIRPFTINRGFALVSFLGPNVDFLQTQKGLPPCRSLGRPQRNAFFVVINKKLVTESGAWSSAFGCCNCP